MALFIKYWTSLSDSLLCLESPKFSMEWPTSSFQPSREDTHPDSLSVNSFLFPYSPAVPGSYPVSSIPATYPDWLSTCNAGFPLRIEPRGWTVNPTDVSGGSDISLQGDVAQAYSACDEIPAGTFAVMDASSGQPETLASAQADSALATPNNVASHQRDKAPESARSPPVFECKWEGCQSSTRFSSEGDLVRHLKSIHISPDAYSCLHCGELNMQPGRTHAALWQRPKSLTQFCN
ncbi:uncharacterized protein KD926_005877 [Aspergillus affinis]|uniref:uncharacterized protein n=1 Tax=Aspergillus affinis TaxID=1070780 RepID=UPI0022FE4588|nr:uncharacterized protein KD926_005877 [Aspergillus affinis]KAI9045934.1 hypothetical protein KD926_005877 [Aspergillus affinis]